MIKKRGVIALDEVWGGWNRARGVCESVMSRAVVVV
jgi:dienelactone hydrolase